MTRVQDIIERIEELKQQKKNLTDMIDNSTGNEVLVSVTALEEAVDIYDECIINLRNLRVDGGE